MDPTLLDSRHEQMPMSVTAELSAVGIVSGKWIAMRTESLDRNGMFLISKEYVCPRSLIEILITVPGRQEPIHAVLTASFIERTWDGFGIGAQISGISSDDQKVLSKIYRQAVARSTPGYSDSLERAPVRAKSYVVVMDRALPIGVLDSLLEQGLEVEIVKTAAEAIKIATRGGADLVVGSLGDHLYDGLELCRSLAGLRNPPRSLFITKRGTVSDFENCLYAGATKVIARPCGVALLVTRIIDLLCSDKYMGLDEDAEDAEEELAELRPLAAPGDEPSLMDSMSEFVTEQLHMLKLNVRTFLHSSTFDRLSALSH